MEQQPAGLRSYVAPRLPSDNGSDAIALAGAAALLQEKPVACRIRAHDRRAVCPSRDSSALSRPAIKPHDHDGGGVRSDVRHCPIRLIDPRNDGFRACKTRYVQDFCEADGGTRTPGPFITSELRRLRTLAAGSLFACSDPDLPRQAASRLRMYPDVPLPTHCPRLPHPRRSSGRRQPGHGDGLHVGAHAGNPTR
jgi:hypothetical protein